MSRARIVHVVQTLGVGGQEMVIYSLVRDADRERFAPVVLSLQELGPVAQRLEALGIPVELVGEPGLTGFPLLRRLISRLRFHRPHLVHTHNPMPHVYGSAARMLGIVPRLIHTKHGRGGISSTKQLWAQRLAVMGTDLFVPVSNDARDVARNHEWVPAHKLRVIHNGVTIAPAPRTARPHSPGQKLHAVHVARLHPIKDQITLLRACRIVADRLPGFVLDIVGDGPVSGDLRAEVEALGLADTVQFHGMRDDVHRYLDAADVFVLSSLSEGISITLLEAMSASVPAVVTDVGGSREVVIEGETGFLVPVGDPPRLAEAMIRILADPDLAQRMGRAGYHRAAEQFNVRQTVAAYETLYLELLQTGGRPTGPAK